MGRLLVKEGINKGQSYSITGDITIGRSSENNIVMEDILISRHHAKITWDGIKAKIIDLQSRNGTWVNNIRIKEKILEDSDDIKIGAHRLTFKEDVAKNVIFSKDDSSIFDINGTIIKPLAELKMTIPDEGITITDSIGDKAKKDSSVALGVELDISEEDAHRNLMILYQITKSLATTTNIRNLLEIIMNQIFKVIDAERGFLLLLDFDTGELIPQIYKLKEPARDKEEKLSISRTIANKVIRDKVAVLTTDTASDQRFSSASSIMLYGIRSALCAPLWNKDEVMGVIYLDSLIAKKSFTEKDLNLLSAIANQAAIGIENAKLNEKIQKEAIMRASLERFMSKQVVDHLITESSAKGTPALTVRDLKATIMFADIRGFTPIAERKSPMEVAEMLNEYFTVMTEVIFKYGGTLDKYIGDSIMAVFGAPIGNKNDAEKAVMTAIEMREELKKMMEGRKETFSIGIGINTGRVVAGTIGSLRRMEYTVLGDAVNVACRLESISKANQILIGQGTYEEIKGKFEIKKVGSISLKGKEKEIEVYEILG